ncbi:hypothetical protein BZA05DRAFT_408642 [Tricharina praecox]|uniref:uncharacterized protein n=1 Tax=Tricharina praecox TaxID=43433 RepID=UPI00221FE20E|nr:uncharacterized protein BZA05DRAFT_408642 [Tricharina praecox]KAI5844837.1 hypothetical protein BZA05DRAFT_408642 [Tricharina praecox]
MENLMLRAPDLVPTSLQMRVQHYPYIDVIPSPALRNRILAALGNSTFVLDQEELCLDIEWGLRVWGRSAWDERSWEWSVEFVEKWLWLFEEETLASTNFWRKQRGEEIIGLTGEEADL